MPGSLNLAHISVDIGLCGGISRKEMKQHLSLVGAPCALQALQSASHSPLNASCLAVSNGSGGELSTHRTIDCDDKSELIFENNNLSSMRGVLQEKQPLAQIADPPSWAVPARGETRLVPVCESLGRQAPVDLTKKACYRVGRSPNNDIQLMHATSSRRHAMLFHHANGFCYVVDCGSAHGTFVNGVRLPSPVKGGVVVPHKVRRGALIRFGGPGAPCFVLKSFSFKAMDVTDCASTTCDLMELVRRNTRMNALGESYITSLKCQGYSDYQAAYRKRSFDSLDSRATLDEDEPINKRIRCSSPPLCLEAPFRLVSPDLSTVLASKSRRVTFSPEPPQVFYPALVTPDELSSEEDNNDGD